jgi:hypothetical protein
MSRSRPPHARQTSTSTSKALCIKGSVDSRPRDEGGTAREKVAQPGELSEMYDPWVTCEFMIWDLMAQHGGMAPCGGSRPAAGPHA